MQPSLLLDETQWSQDGGLLTLQSICSQPRLWCEGFHAVQQHSAAIDHFWQQMGNEPRNIILCGAGSSLSAARVAAQWLQQQTGRDIQVLASTDIVVKPELYLTNRPTLLVSVTSSGSTPESVAVFEHAEHLIDDCYHLIIANDPQGELPRRSQQHAKALYIPAPNGTKNGSFAAAAEFTLPIWYLLLIFLPQHWDIAQRALNVYQHGADYFLTQQAEKIAAIAQRDAPVVVSLGSSSLQFIAADASLKLLEMCNGKQATDDFSTLAFRHGPKLIVNQPVTVVCYLSPDQQILRYDLDMATELKAQRHQAGKIIGIYAEADPRIAQACDEYLHFDAAELTQLPEVFSGLLYVMFAQLLGLMRARQLGVTPDLPSNDGKVAKVCKVTLYGQDFTDKINA